MEGAPSHEGIRLAEPMAALWLATGLVSGCARSDRPDPHERTSVALAAVRHPALLVAAADSPAPLREPTDALGLREVRA